MKRIIVYSRMWRSGTGLYAQGVAQGIAAAGYPVTFIAPAGAPTDPAAAMPQVKRICPPREFTEREAARRAARAIRSLRRIAGGLGALLVARLSSSRIVVTIPEPLLFWLPVLLLLRLSGAQVVYICHDPEPHAWRLPGGLRWLERGAHRASYMFASRIVVLATSGKVALERLFGVPAAKIAIIPHGAFDAPQAAPVPGNAMLLAFGTIRRNKQVHVAMQAVVAARAAGADVTLIAAGGADANDPDYIDECRAIADASGGAVKLEAGYIADERVAELFDACDALLLPYTDFESQSGVAVLAGMAGRPVICAAAGGIPDLIDAGLAAVVIADPAGVAEVTVAIGEFLATPADEWTRRAFAGRDSLSEALAWPRIGHQFGALFT